jgi:hypothetical protein
VENNNLVIKDFIQTQPTFNVKRNDILMSINGLSVEELLAMTPDQLKEQFKEKPLELILTRGDEGLWVVLP